MILVDANILICASISDFSQHRAAREWLDGQLNGRARVGLLRPSLLAFLGIVTNRRALVRPLATEDAWSRVTGWFGCLPVWVPQPTERHAETVAQLLALPGV